MSRTVGGSVLLAAMPGLIITLALTSLSSLSGSSYATEAASYAGNNASLTAPILKDASGKPLTTPPKVGQMVVISTTLASNGTTSSNASSTSADSSIPFIVIVEARNELGITEYSQFAIGRLMNGNSSSEVGLSWTPDASGRYELKAFALSDLNDPVLLALPESSIATVQQ